MKVKICGITNLADAQLCEDAGTDALGFVHFPNRRRSIPLEEIATICHAVGPMVTKVLVCAPRDAADALDMVERSSTDAIQLYSMDHASMNDIRDQGIKVIRAVRPVRSEALRFADAADALLFEEGVPGTGTSHDYSRIPVGCCSRAIIAGGLNIGNLDDAKRMEPYALDVSSGVESASGRKDPDLVSEFVRRCRL
ncbi:MAG: phosphoribosylanthranilate isomerase [Methanobacteriota archaeon]|nr:MAG: phosphoribosylanthranilate isomerase [Euryarchaeota archaeon]